MSKLDDAIRDVNDEDIGTGGYTHPFTGAASLVDAGELKAGRYYMVSDQAVWVKRGDTGVVANKTIATEFKLAANVYWPVRVTHQDLAEGHKDGTTSRAYFSVIADSSSGTIQFFRVDRDGA